MEDVLTASQLSGTGVSYKTSTENQIINYSVYLNQINNHLQYL